MWWNSPLLSPVLEGPAGSSSWASASGSTGEERRERAWATMQVRPIIDPLWHSAAQWEILLPFNISFFLCQSKSILLLQCRRSVLIGTVLRKHCRSWDWDGCGVKAQLGDRCQCESFPEGYSFWQVHPRYWLIAQGGRAEWADWTLCWSLKLEFVQLSSHTLTLTSYWVTSSQY